jgi:hypothetical protein
MSSCEDPATPAPPAQPSGPKNINYDRKNYVYALDEEPYQNWDFQGNDSRNSRYCHGMVSASKGASKNNKYN